MVSSKEDFIKFMSKSCKYGIAVVDIDDVFTGLKFLPKNYTVNTAFIKAVVTGKKKLLST
jgi:hypothetical protein